MSEKYDDGCLWMAVFALGFMILTGFGRKADKEIDRVKALEAKVEQLEREKMEREAK